MARAAGVDKSTVSRVLNGSGTVAATTRERIISVARELGYRPSAAARALRSGSSSALGVAIAGLGREAAAQFLAGAQAEASRESRAVLVADLESCGPGHPPFELSVDASIGWGWLTEGQRRALNTGPAAPLLVGECAVSQFIGSQEEQIASMAAFRALARLGHQKVALVEEHEDLGTIREAALRDALYESPLSMLGQTEVVRVDEATPQGAFDAVRALLTERWTSAIAVGSPGLAPAVLEAVSESGLQVGEEVSVLLFGDSEWARAYRPQLSVVAHEVMTDGRLAAELALNPSMDLATFEVGQHWEFIPRASFGPPRFMPGC
ncbi:MAG: LacI family transcriptional regulator [Dehalococcoidia bacterium]|nr:LacI family transcriptional regulator [Dehalococcoidia bacterium]